MIERIFGWLDYIFNNYYSFILSAAVIILIGIILGRLIEKIVQRSLNAMEVNLILKKITGMNLQMEKKLSKFAAFIVYTVAVIMALNTLNVTTTVLMIIFTGAIIAFVVGSILAIKDFIPNATSGFFIVKNKVIQEGQKVEINGIEGVVESITLIETKLKTKEGNVVHIPNSSITKSEVIVKKSKALKK